MCISAHIITLTNVSNSVESYWFGKTPNTFLLKCPRPTLCARTFDVSASCGGLCGQHSILVHIIPCDASNDESKSQIAEKMGEFTQQVWLQAAL